MVYVIRNSLKYVSYKDREAFSKTMKGVYQAPTDEAALMALDELKHEWGDKYILAVGVW